MVTIQIQADSKLLSSEFMSVFEIKLGPTIGKICVTMEVKFTFTSYVRETAAYANEKFSSIRRMSSFLDDKICCA